MSRRQNDIPSFQYVNIPRSSNDSPVTTDAMGDEIDEHELEEYMKSCTLTIASVSTLIEEPQPNLPKIRSDLAILRMETQYIESLRPTKKTSKVDFKPACTLLLSAKRTMIRAESLLEEHRDSRNDDKPDKTQTDNGFSRRIPEMHIQPFDGDITKYSSFRSSFHLKYDKLPLEDRERLQFLKKHCTGDALQLIERLAPEDKNYQFALDKLDENFNNEEAVISALYVKLESIPCSSNKTDALQATFYEVESILGALEAHNQDVDKLAALRDKVYHRYPTWLISQACNGDFLPVKTFQKAVSKQIRFRDTNEKNAAAQAQLTRRPIATTSALTTSKASPKQQPTKQNESKTSPKPTSNGTPKPDNTTRRPPTCVFCDEVHYSAECTKFATLAVRSEKLKDRCTLCFSREHAKAQCQRVTRCYYCKAMNSHHTSLCPVKFGTTTPEPPPHQQQNGSGTGGRTTAFVQKHSGAHCTAIVTLENPHTQRQFYVRALFDSGSNESYIEEETARRTGLQLTPFKNVPVNVFHQTQPVSFQSATTAFTVTNGSTFRISVVADTAPRLPQDVRLFDLQEFLQTYPEHRYVSFANQGASNRIELLLGSDYYYDFIKVEDRTPVTEGLYIISSQFGAILVGRQREASHTKNIFYQFSPQRAIESMCALDAIGINEKPLSQTQAEEAALEQFYANIEMHDQRYRIRLPWKEFPPRIAGNFGVAVARLKAVTRRFTQTSFDEYAAIIETQLQTGIIEEVNAANIDTENSYFLPHHAVISPEKSTPLRIVFDGSAKTRSGLSLNDTIHKGVNLIGQGCGIQMRFRLHRYVIVSDVEKAFHQILSHPDDQPFLSFVFIRDLTKPVSGRNLRYFRFLRYVFGVIASPFVLQATTKYHIRKFLIEFAAILERDIYVDGILSGFYDLETLFRFYKAVCELFAKCSMNVRKWATNDGSTRLKFEQPDRSASISVLGTSWNQYDDTIRIKPLIAPVYEETTLRNVLSRLALFYDPCGMWLPVVVAARVFLREIHASYAWDDVVSNDHRDRWINLFDELRAASDHVMPRFQCDINEPAATFELHAFADASAKACACVVYLKRITPTQSDMHLLFSRARLAKELEIPKLELIAMYMATQAISFVTKQLPISIARRVIWTDSTCVLAWVENTSRLLPVFVQRRVDDIRNEPSVEKRFIAGTINPADFPSRGTTTQQLLDSNWFSGPLEWTSNPPSTAPIESTPNYETFFIHAQPIQPDPPPAWTYPFDINIAEYAQKRNGYLALLRITMLAMRFVYAFQAARHNEHFESSPSLRTAQIIWIRFEQRNHYADVFAAIESRTPHRLIKKLNLYIDPRGIIRCAGRLMYAPLTAQEREPILLPSASVSIFVRMLIVYYHTSQFHTGTSYTLAAIRRRFWIPCGRRAVYNIVESCVNCRRFGGRPYRQPDESSLPEFRLTDKATPFSKIGIDTFGPLFVNNEKRFCLVVTDLVIRAVDLELLETMSAETIFLALRRIIARRSTPSFIVSDNAPQFVALSQSFSAVYTHEFKWHFIVEHAPWMGGVYERIVGLVKASILRTLHGRAIGESTLRTILAEIAAMLNSRPLTYVGADDTEVITPNHFLHSYYERESDENANVDRYWSQSNEMANQFWNLWKTTYLQWLREQAPWSNNRRTVMQPPAIGDVVLIRDKVKKRNHWLTGRIINLPVSSDGQIRSAQVKTANGVLHRPIGDLHPIETSIRIEPDENIAVDAPTDDEPRAIEDIYIPDDVHDAPINDDEQRAIEDIYIPEDILNPPTDDIATDDAMPRTVATNWHGYDITLERQEVSISDDDSDSE